MDRDPNEPPPAQPDNTESRLIARLADLADRFDRGVEYTAARLDVSESWVLRLVELERDCRRMRNAQAEQGET